MDESVSKTFGDAHDAVAKSKKRLQQVAVVYLSVIAAAVLISVATLVSPLADAPKLIVVVVVLVLSLDVAVVAVRRLRNSEAAARKALIAALQTKNEADARRWSRADGRIDDVTRGRSLGG